MSEIIQKGFGGHRWLRKRSGEMVLQEPWINVYTGEITWRDVPVVDEPLYIAGEAKEIDISTWTMPESPEEGG